MHERFRVIVASPSGCPELCGPRPGPSRPACVDAPRFMAYGAVPTGLAGVLGAGHAGGCGVRSGGSMRNGAAAAERDAGRRLSDWSHKRVVRG